MTKLKTIKDLTEEYSMCSLCAITAKKEAVKWVLDIVKKNKNPFKAFMEFHNITDEDL